MIRRMFLIASSMVIALGVFSGMINAQSTPKAGLVKVSVTSVKNLGECTTAHEVDCIKIDWSASVVVTSTSIAKFQVEANAGGSNKDTKIVSGSTRTATLKLFHQGSSFTVTVKALDANNNVLATAQGTGSFL